MLPSRRESVFSVSVSHHAAPSRVTGPVESGDADLVILPGSKATIADLGVIRREGWDVDIAAHVRRGSRLTLLLRCMRAPGARTCTYRIDLLGEVSVGRLRVE